jgi:hypothetical protein
MELGKQFGHDGFTVQAFAAMKRFKTLGDFRLNLVRAKPATLGQISFDRLAHQFGRRAMFLFGSRLNFGNQGGGN